jgi:uncharacterized protein (TIGR02231 family)
MRSPLTLLFVLLSLPLTTYAATLTPANNRIDAVTVFLDRAEVTRQLEVSVNRGAHTIEVSGLPAQLIVASLGASGKGPKGLRIGSVETRRVFGEKAAKQEERKLREKLQSLNDSKAQLEGKIQALNTQAAFIEKLAQLPGNEGKEGERHFEPQKWASAWQAIGSGMAETNAARITLNQEIRELKQQIRKVEQQLRQIQTGRRDTLSALLHIEADNPGKARFTLSYQLPNATWTPGYEAHLATEQGKLDITQAASVRQSSGEDWSNVTLTVSTARPSAGAVMPELSPWWIDFPRPVPRASRLRMEKKAQFADEMVAGAMAPMEEPLAEADAEEIVATTQASEFSVRYRIPGRVSVPADNSQQRFVLTKQQFKTTLGARTTPKRDPRAFLYAEFDYSGETPLLAGTWQLQRDGVYVGKSRQKVVRPGEPLALAFGPDDAIKVEYQLLQDERGKQGLINRERRVERRYLINITNGHKLAVPVSVFDQIPVPRDEAIKVALSKDSSKPSETDVDERKGVLKWQRDLKPGGKAEIKFGYSVSFPQDKNVPGF